MRSWFSSSTPEAFAARWIATGVAALAWAGLLAILLVIARTPQLQFLMPGEDFFHVALIVHVDLAVLIWFLAFASALWSLHADRVPVILAKSAWWCFTAGTTLMGICPFLGADQPLLNNYIPVLMHPLFFLALSLVLAGILLQLAATVRVMLQCAPGVKPSAILMGVSASQTVTGVALVAFVMSYLKLPKDVTGQAYYEELFWAGGHLLQFTHTQVMMVCWLMLAAACGIKVRIPEGALRFLLGFGGALALATLTMLPFLPVTGAMHRGFFTDQMRWFGGIVPAIIGIMLVLGARGAVSELPREQRLPLLGNLWASVLLFASGGVIGYLIAGINVTIPAHYHGSIVGVTLALMGGTYLLLPRFGAAPVTGRMAVWQPRVYAVGQLMHIGGLAYSGGYGVARKTIASGENVEAVRIALGMMGMGGMLAIIGGILFVVAVVKAVRAR